MMKFLMILAAISLSACATPGDFCDVVPGPILFDRDTGRVILATDLDSARAISAQNAYWRSVCGG